MAVEELLEDDACASRRGRGRDSQDGASRRREIGEVVLAWKSDSVAVSWLLVHWLYNTQPDAFAAYQVKLAKGVDPTVAWPDSMQGGLEQGAKRGRPAEAGGASGV